MYFIYIIFISISSHLITQTPQNPQTQPPTSSSLLSRRPKHKSTNSFPPTSLRARSLRHPIHQSPIRHSRILAITRIIILRLVQASRLDRQKSLQFAPTIRSVAAGREARTQRQRALIDEEMDVRGRWSRRGHVGVSGGGAIGGDGTGGFDDFNVDAGAEGGGMGDDELLVGRGSGRREELGELCETESGEHGCEVGVVGEVKVEALVEGKRGSVVIDGDVGLGCSGIQGVIVHSREELFDVSYSDCTTSW